VDIYGLEPFSLCACRISLSKSFKFPATAGRQVPNSRFVSPRNFSLFYYSLSNKLYERCVVVRLIVCLFCFDILILSFPYFGTLCL